MNIINIENLSKAFGENVLLDDVSFTLDEGEKVGLIGINGTGKSTLLKIVAGIETGDSGKYTRATNLTLSFLPQTPEFPEGATVLEGVIAEHPSTTDMWTLEAEAKSMLNQLGISDFEQPIAELSGGQRKRAALVRTLLSEADVLILDEPTNHLDAFMSEWLEEYLRNYRGTLLMVTHDRYFLDAVTNRIVEIDKGKLYSYKTNYRGFLQLKAEREEMQEAAMRKLRSMLRVELEWMQRGAEARRTKQKKQIRQYEEHAAIKAPKKDAELELSSISSRMGKTTVELENIAMRFGEREIFRDFTYIFLRDDRVGFVGPNGCGKTTLMKIITGELLPAAGQVTIGQTIKIGYYAQELRGASGLNPNQRVIDYIKDTAEFVRTKEGLVSASVMLDRFLFPPEKQYTLLGKLSGGEIRRLNLLRVLMEQPNVLILDEPTNDLDIGTLIVLEDFLDSFDGIVITVSHDRYFLDRIVRRIFAFEDGTLQQYEGGYTDYLSKRPDPQEKDNVPVIKSSKGGNAVPEKAPVKRAHEEKLRFSFKEQREYETIDADIEAMEEKIALLERQIEANATNSLKLQQLSEEKEQAEAALAEKMDRWVYLNELAEKIAKG